MIAAVIMSVAASVAADEITLREWVKRTALLESTNDRRKVGDHGASRGLYQIQRRTWGAYSRRPWRTAAHDPRESQRVARAILLDCARACRRDGRAVTFKNVRWYFRHGGFPTPKRAPAKRSRK